MSEQPWIGPNGQVMRRLELHLTYTCPERCVFCSEEHRMEQFRAFPVTFGRVATVLRQHARRGVTNVHFTGGEPTIHPRFVDVLRLAKKLGMRTSIGTIGTRLADHTFAERAVPFLDEDLFSIHGPNAALHNGRARRPGSFERVTTRFNVLDVIQFPAYKYSRHTQQCGCVARYGFIPRSIGVEIDCDFQSHPGGCGFR